MMSGQGGTHFPVVIIMDGKQKTKCKSLRNWFINSPFLAYEAIDAFDIIEKLSDFTVEANPQVIFLQVESLSDDYVIIEKFVNESTGHEPNLPIYTFSDDRKYPRSVTSIRQLQMSLNEMFSIPEVAMSKHNSRL